MAYTNDSELHAAIFAELKTELEHEPLFKEEILSNKVWDAIREVRRRRCYQNSSLSEEQIMEDLDHHYSVIKQAALIYYNRIGSEGETVHYENTVHRSFFYDDDIYTGVIPFVKVLF